MMEILQHRVYCCIPRVAGDLNSPASYGSLSFEQWKEGSEDEKTEQQFNPPLWVPVQLLPDSQTPAAWLLPLLLSKQVSACECSC